MEHINDLKPSILAPNENPFKKWYFIVAVIIGVLILTGLSSCNKKNELGTPRKITVSWNDTINYRPYLGATKVCAAPSETYTVNIAVGQRFFFDVSLSNCVKYAKAYDVYVYQEGKLIYTKKATKHNIDLEIR